MRKPVKYSVIIPTFNKLEETLRPCLDSLVQYTDLTEMEVIVVANGCTDGTLDYLIEMMKLNPQIRMIWSDDALGYTKATNLGIKSALGKFIIPLNNDNQFLPQRKNEWIEMLEAPFINNQMDLLESFVKSKENVGMTGPMMTEHRGRKFLIFFCVMIARKVFEDIGLLDEIFSPGYGEDTDFCFRMENAGYTMVQVPYNTQTYYGVNQMTGGFPIYHKGNVTFKNWPGGEELLAKNNEILKERYFKENDLHELPAVTRRPNVYDCFPFFNELDVLEIRLEELWDVVDRFIIVEAIKTHSNKPKPLYFNENLKRFEKYLNKITYYVVEDIPAYSPNDTWTIERHQRDCIMRCLNDCSDDDVVIISDVDEIPSKHAVEDYLSRYSDGRKTGLKCFEQSLSYYYLNCVSDIPWRYSVILPFADLKKLTPCGARYFGDNTGGYKDDRIIKNGGWHFSYMGGPDKVKEKIGATAHQEFNTPELNNMGNIIDALEKGRDVYGRNHKYKFENVSDSYPLYVQRNIRKLENAGLLKSTKADTVVEYIPQKRDQPRTADVFTAWGDIHTILKDIVDRFIVSSGLEPKLALEFGVEWGFSASAISNYFKRVIGVDTFVGDAHSSYKMNHYDVTRSNLVEFPNIELIQNDYKDFIKDPEFDTIYDLIHIDIIHTYEDTYACGEWAVKHGRVIIFHDTESFPDVRRAVQDLSDKHKLRFYNYKPSHGLGILINNELLK